MFRRGITNLVFALVGMAFVFRAEGADLFKVVAGGSPKGPASEMNILLNTDLTVADNGTIYLCCSGGNLWGGVFQIDIDAPHTLSQVPHTTIFDSYQSYLRVQGGFIVDKKGQVYIQNPQGLIRIDPNSGNRNVVVQQNLLNSCGSIPFMFDESGGLYCLDNGLHPTDGVRRLEIATGAITSIAGSGAPLPTPVPSTPIGDGGPATSAILSGLTASGVTLDGAGGLLILDRGGAFLRRVDPVTSKITTILNVASLGSGASALNTIAADSQFVYLGLPNNTVIRIEETTGKAEKLAGNGMAGFGGDGGDAGNAGLNFPSRLALDHHGGLLIGDVNNYRVRRVDLSTNIITTIAGNGTQRFAGEGTPAVNASLGSVAAIAFDSHNNLYFADLVNSRVRRVDANTNIITTYAGNGKADWSGDGDLATNASLNCPFALAFDGADNLYIADFQNHRIRRVDGATHKITTVAGNGSTTPSGDGGPAEVAGLGRPSGIVVDSLLNLFITDYDMNTLRVVDARTQHIQSVLPSFFVAATRNYVSRLLIVGESLFAMLDKTFYSWDLSARSSLLGAPNYVQLRGWKSDGTPNDIPLRSLTMQAGTCRTDVPSLGCSFGSLAADQAGNVYFSDPGTGQVRRVSAASGQVTEVLWRAVPPEGIAISADQTLCVGTAANGEEVILSAPLSSLAVP